MRRWFFPIAISLCLFIQPLAQAADFKTAKSSYDAGKYPQALAEFKELKGSYPNNELVHYYLALCYQATNQMQLAKNEYEWVSTRGRTGLKAQAAKGLQQLSGLRSPSSSGGSPPVAIASAAGATAPGAGGTKVKKIIEFYADW